MILLQRLYQRNSNGSFFGNSEWLVKRCILNESRHAPYRYIMESSALIDSAVSVRTRFAKELWTTGNHPRRNLVSFCLLELEGISTKRVKLKQIVKNPAPTWTVEMSIDVDESTLVPEGAYKD